jgi:2-oxo-3-hexenedioate decarboxylase
MDAAGAELDLETAYDLAWRGVQARLAAGERLVGARITLTSKAAQRAMGAAAPVHGFVTSGMIAPYGEPLDLARFTHPLVQPQIGFLLARDVEAPATVASVLAATSSVFLAADVLDSRSADHRGRLGDLVANNANAGALLLGPRAVAPSDIDDLALVGCVLRVNGAVVATAAGAAVMGHPAASVAWLANQLGQRKEHLPAGWMVFSGGLTEPVPLTAGSTVSVELDGLGALDVVGH